MMIEQDYRVLARVLVQIHGEGALEYAQKYVETSGNPSNEPAIAWRAVYRIIEKLNLQNARRRKSDQFLC